ncbi:MULTISPECIES: molybdate ABC transporter substrate-binding protein [Bacillaceae]|uniref:Molybdate ABC transporter substrate-binding protein n=1 Tax=Evansella alkalicola TaxID=745819 RepID=A0ABS6JPV9_9BACI|nr:MULTISPECIES: molybdate ABC transporter substrate-binding protein [Bacillaceae]MBU9720136.1 molybdate ABC transporter substrate-binding protein [Bacillus alkalicola]
MLKRYLLALFPIILLFGCNNAQEEERTLYVAAASDLYHALTEIGNAFAEEYDVNIEYTYGSTGLLTQQIQEGAPFDLFLAAHESFIDQLIRNGAVHEDSKEYYAIGRLVAMSSSEEEVNLDVDYLLSSDVKTITIANPEHAPYGKAAKETLEYWGIWEEIQPKLVLGENIRQSYQYVETGNADVGLIALALMNRTGFYYELIDDASHDTILQALGIPVQSGERELAGQFVEFILSDEGQGLLKEYGFDKPSY